MTDNELILLLRNGQHHKSLMRLYKYERITKAYITKNSGSKADGQDIFQEALIILCKKVNDDRFQLTSSLDSYLFGISKLLWHNELRRRGKMSFASADHDIQADMEELVDAEERYSMASQVLQSIGDACKRMLELFYIQRKSMAQITLAMNYSNENSAKNQKYKCLEKARGAYHEMLNQSKTINA